MERSRSGNLRKPAAELVALWALEVIGYGFMIAAGAAFASGGDAAVLVCIPLAAIATRAVGAQIQRTADALWKERIDAKLRAQIR